MSCGGNKGCGAGECPGCCKSNGERAYQDNINSIVELEMHYSEEAKVETAAYIFESIYCLTNMQNRELRVTGLEGNKYDSLDNMRLQIIDYLLKTDIIPCELCKNIDVIYIRDDVEV